VSKNGPALQRRVFLAQIRTSHGLILVFDCAPNLISALKLIYTSGVAIGLVSTSRLIGGAIATAIYTSIYSNHYAGEIPAQIAAAAKSSGFTGSVAALLTASATNTAAAYNAVAGMTREFPNCIEFYYII
jgi:hypothetical protein